MRRSSLQRKAPISRSKPLRKRSPRRVAKRKAHRPWLAWLHEGEGECAGKKLAGHFCEGRGQALHIRNLDGVPTGLGLKESDVLTIRGCQALNFQYDNAYGPFEGTTLEKRQLWFLAELAILRTLYQLETGESLPGASAPTAGG